MYTRYTPASEQRRVIGAICVLHKSSSEPVGEIVRARRICRGAAASIEKSRARCFVHFPPLSSREIRSDTPRLWLRREQGTEAPAMRCGHGPHVCMGRRLTPLLRSIVYANASQLRSYAYDDCICPVAAEGTLPCAR